MAEFAKATLLRQKQYLEFQKATPLPRNSVSHPVRVNSLTLRAVSVRLKATGPGRTLRRRAIGVGCIPTRYTGRFCPSFSMKTPPRLSWSAGPPRGRSETYTPRGRPSFFLRSLLRTCRAKLGRWHQMQHDVHGYP